MKPYTLNYSQNVNFSRNRPECIKPTYDGTIQTLTIEPSDTDELASTDTTAITKPIEISEPAPPIEEGTVSTESIESSDPDEFYLHEPTTVTRKIEPTDPDELTL